MNLLLLSPEDFSDGTTVMIADRRFQHLKKILRLQVGQSLRVGLLDGPLGRGTLLALDKQHAVLTVQLDQPAPPPATGTVILGLPRPLMLKRILQAITSLGVKDIHFIHSDRVEKSYWHSSDLEESVIHQQLLLGLEQSMDTRLPRVTFHRHFRPFVQEHLSGITSGKQALLAHPGNYPPCPANLAGPFVLAMGPEGGFTDTEVAHFASREFHPIQIGQRILRVETAVSVLLGKLLPC